MRTCSPSAFCAACAAEGVITNGFALTQFNVGAFSPGKPVVPVCLRYPWRQGNPKCANSFLASMAWRLPIGGSTWCHRISPLSCPDPSPSRKPGIIEDSGATSLSTAWRAAGSRASRCFLDCRFEEDTDIARGSGSGQIQTIAAVNIGFIHPF